MSIYTSQYEEHLDAIAGEASEFQNCFTEAQNKVSKIAFEQAALIHRARTLGLWVVVEVSAYYCKATDALAGHYDHFICAFPTRESADQRAEALAIRNYEVGDFEQVKVIAPL